MLSMNHTRWLRRLATEETLLETEQPEPGRLCHFHAPSRGAVRSCLFEEAKAARSAALQRIGTIERSYWLAL